MSAGLNAMFSTLLSGYLTSLFAYLAMLPAAQIAGITRNDTNLEHGW